VALERFSSVTVVNRSYLARADVMFASLARLHPDVPRLALLVDRWPEGYPRPQHFDVVTLEQLAPPNMWRRLFGYTRFERTTTWKSLALRLALERYPGCPSALLLDADMEILSPLDQLVQPLHRASVLLTPHLLGPLPGVDYSQLSRAGSFNAGFLGVSAERGLPFLQWWESQLEHQCRVDHPAGLFLEQRWLDHVPALFEDAAICRHPGANTAYWNLTERPLTGSPEALLCAGRPVMLFHYSGWSPHRPRLLSAHLGGRYEPAAESPLAALLHRYHLQVANSIYAPLDGHLSAYDVDFQGRVIPEADSLFFGDVLAPLTSASFNPYQGLPNSLERRLMQGLFRAVRHLPSASQNPRETPLYRTLSQWAKGRRARAAHSWQA
jgi:hypothetical protein